MSITNYTVEDIKVSDVEVDRKVQRSGLEMHKIERIKRDWNPDAEGVYHVSRRKSGQQVLLDGAHRWTVKKELTDNQGVIRCHVFEGLTVEEEAEIFLALNNTTQPLLIDKFRVRVVSGDEQAVAIDDIVKMYGWTINRTPGPHHIQAVGALEKIYRASKKLDREPNDLQLTMLVLTRAWGNERAAGAAVLIEGVGRVLIEHGSKIDIENLVEKLKEYKGGPVNLHAQAAQMAAIRRGRVYIAVAELVVEAYNRGKRVDSSNALPKWTKRS